MPCVLSTYYSNYFIMTILQVVTAGPYFTHQYFKSLCFLHLAFVISLHIVENTCRLFLSDNFSNKK